MFVTQGQKLQPSHQMAQQKNNNEQRMREQQQQAICDIFFEANENQNPELLSQLSKQFEQQAFIMSNNEINKDYRTKVNAIKMRLKGSRGAFIRQTLYQNTISVEELLSLDFDKLNEDSLSKFLSSKGRSYERQLQVPQRKVTTTTAHIPPKPFRPAIGKITTYNQKFGDINEQPLNEQDNVQGNVIENFESWQMDKIIHQDIMTTENNFAEEEIHHQEGDSNFVNKYNCPQSIAQQIQQLHFIDGDDGSNWIEAPKNEIPYNDDQQQIFRSLSPLPSSNMINQEFINETGPQIESQSVEHILDKEIEESERAYYDNNQKVQNQILPLDELQNNQYEQQGIIEEVNEQLQTEEKQNSQQDDSILRMNLLLQNQLQENQNFYELEINQLKSQLLETQQQFAKLQENYDQQSLQLQKVQENYKKDIEILQNRIKEQGARNYEAPQSSITEQILQIVNENKRLSILVTQLKQELQNQTDTMKQKFSEKDQEESVYVKKLTVIEELVKEIRSTVDKQSFFSGTNQCTQVSQPLQTHSEIILKNNQVLQQKEQKSQNNYLFEPLKLSQNFTEPKTIEQQTEVKQFQKTDEKSDKKVDQLQVVSNNEVPVSKKLQLEDRKQNIQNSDIQQKSQQSQSNQNIQRQSRPNRREQRTQVPGSLFD